MSKMTPGRLLVDARHHRRKIITPAHFPDRQHVEAIRQSHWLGRAALMVGAGMSRNTVPTRPVRLKNLAPFPVFPRIRATGEFKEPPTRSIWRKDKWLKNFQRNPNV
jgi:hypothetical protein